MPPLDVLQKIMKNLSQEEQDRLEADFLRDEADREMAEQLSRRRKKEKIKFDISFEAVRAFSVFAVGFLLVASFDPSMIGGALMMTALWIAAVTVCILKMRATAQQPMADQDSDGNAEKPPGVERES